MKRKNLMLALIMNILWIGFPGFGRAQILLTEKVIRADFQGATCIAAADFNGDGFKDFVVTANTGDKVGWFENDGNQLFTEHIIIGGFNGAKGVAVGKIDGNDTWDIVATAKLDGRFSWFGNNGSGQFTEHVITDSTWTSADYVEVADLDQDGDQDLILVACDNHRIAWAENDGNGGFTIHILKENWNKANWASVADLDKDGSMDIIATAKAGQIIWFRNDGEENFVQDTLYDQLDGVNSVRVADLDGDGDLDLAATACGNSNLVAWFENDGGYTYTMHLLRDHYAGARACEIHDLDQDGDTDILSIAWQGALVNFWENDGSGHFTERIISDKAYDMIRIHVTDLDRDGDPDILGACFGNDEIRWWENINTFLLPGFTSDSLSGQNHLRVHFQDLSVSKPVIKSWAWDFDNDGVTDSYDQNPYHDFVLPGYYTVKLRVASDSLTDSIVRQDCIRVFDGESALEFNGTDSRMLCEQGTILNITGPFTFEAWIRPDGFGATGIGKIFDKSAISLFTYRSGNVVQSDTCLALIMTHQGGKVSTVATPPGSLKLTEWQHVAVTYHDSSGRLKIFIDGAEQLLEIVNPPEGPVSGNELKPLAIGNAINGNMAFTGCIDECRLWSAERTPEEIMEWMDLNLPDGQSGLHGYWKLNEGNGDTAYDHSGIGRNGKLQKLQWAQGVHLATLSVEEEHDIRERPVVIRVQPNPASGMVTFSIVSEIRGEFRAAVFNSNGLKVTDLPSFRCQRNKEHVLTWDCRTGNRKSCPPGVYFLTLTTGNTTVTEKIIII